MASLFIISGDQSLREACRTALRKLDVQTTFCIDHIDALREMGWTRPDLVVWEMDPENPRESRGLKVLREKYRAASLFLLVPDTTDAGVAAEMASQILPKYIDVPDLVKEITDELNLEAPQTGKPQTPTGKESYDFDYDLDASESSK